MLRAVPSRFFHATSLHYVPYLLATGVLLSQRRILAAGLPIRPRPTAARRDRKLRIDGYVHLSFEPGTPLLTDKLARGYPHVLIEFDREVAELPGAAFMRYNSKAWRHRDDFAPISEEAEKAWFVQAWCDGQFPSAELLISEELSLSPLAVAVHVATAQEETWLQRLRADVSLPPAPPIRRTPNLFPLLPVFDMTPYIGYAAACVAAGKVLPPSNLPFD